MFSKKKKESLAGEICIGVGLLFVGLTFMSGSVAPYTDAPIFAKAFAVLGRNPILGILVGALVTAIIQSSTAFCRYLTDSGDEWSGIRKCRDLYYTWTEYRILPDCAFIQCRYKPQR